VIPSGMDRRPQGAGVDHVDLGGREGKTHQFFQGAPHADIVGDTAGKDQIGLDTDPPQQVLHPPRRRIVNARGDIGPRGRRESSGLYRRDD